MYATGPRELQSSGVEAVSFELLADHALRVLSVQGSSGIVCGPISTGGTNDQRYNFDIFNAVIRGRIRDGKKVFNQIPYEFGLRKLAYAWEDAGNDGYCMPILDVFYRTLFESGYITAGWFIPGWESSFGAQFERREFQRLGICVVDLPYNYIEQCMLAEHTEDYVHFVTSLIKQ